MASLSPPLHYNIINNNGPNNSIVELSDEEIKRKNKNELQNAVIQARDDILILTQALAASASDLGVESTNDLKGVLLYDLALSQQARATLAIDLARKNEKMKSLQKTVSTLSFVREANNMELVKCERRIKELEQQLEQKQSQVATATHSQSQLTTLVSAHHSLSSQLSSSQQQLSSSQLQLSTLQQQISTTERERETLSSQLSRLGMQYKELEGQCSSMQAQHQQVLESSRAQHQLQLESTRAQGQAQLETAREQANRREQALQRELDRCHQQLAGLREQHLKQTESEHGWREKREVQIQKEMEQMKIQYEAELAQVRSQLEQMGGVVDSEKAKIRSEFEQTIAKWKDRYTEATKQVEVLTAEVAKVKNKESTAQDKLTSLRAEYARQGRMNSFQEVVGAQMANVRSQLDESKQMYERVSAENALLSSENSRLLLLLDEEIKARQPRSPSPAFNRPSTPLSTLTSSFVDVLPPKSPIPTSPLRPSSPLRSSSALTRAEAIPLEPTTTTTITITTSPSSSPKIVSDRSHRPRSASNPPSLSNSSESITSPITSPTSSNASSPKSKSPLLARKSPLLVRRHAAMSNPASLSTVNQIKSPSSSPHNSPTPSHLDSDSSSVSSVT